MILPTKHENLSHASIVVGGTLLKTLGKKSWVIEDLYEVVRDKHLISLSSFFDVMVFLWLGGFIEMNSYEVHLKKELSDVS